MGLLDDLTSPPKERADIPALPPDIRFAGELSNLMGPQAGSTWGLGFAIRNDAASSLVPGSVGSFSWNGIIGTYFWVDPAEQLIAVQLIQVAPTTGGSFQRMFRNLTYGALSVPDQGVPAAQDRCLCHSVGTPQVQADAPPDQRGARLVRPVPPGDPHLFAHWVLCHGNGRTSGAV